MTDCLKSLKDSENFVISTVGGKGGAGNTTFSYNLLWFLVSNGIKTCILDLDNGQNSSTEFSLDRKDAGIKPNLPVYAVDTSNLEKELQKLSKEYQVLILEFGKSEKEKGVKKALALAIKVSDLIVKPCQPTPADVKCIPLAEKILLDLKVNIPAYIIPNRVKKESQLNVIYGVRSFLKAFKVTSNFITDKLCYQDSLGFDGRSVFEMSGREPKKAQQELQQIFKEIFNVKTNS